VELRERLVWHVQQKEFLVHSIILLRKEDGNKKVLFYFIIFMHNTVPLCNTIPTVSVTPLFGNNVPEKHEMSSGTPVPPVSASEQTYVQYSPPFFSEFTQNTNQQKERNIENPNITPFYLYEPIFSFS
jgi:hypothetical protein